MSRVPLGKVLLRNVIRHTDAHNKIQEESEMWKIREMEKQSKDIHWGKEKGVLPNCSSSRMRSDGFDEETPWKARSLTSVSVTTEEDLQHARYWNKKLYEYEANMPDRWGHSGYKELYPEEFDTDSDGEEQDEQNSVNGQRLSQHGKQSSLEVPKRKKAKKSHKKKRKKKSHKKRKKKKQEQRSPATDSSQDSEHSQTQTGRRKRKRHKKAKKGLPRVPASSSGQESDSSKGSLPAPSSSEDSEAEEKQPKKKRRKHHGPVLERGGEKAQEKRSKRKNWKVAGDENSEDSSDED